MLYLKRKCLFILCIKSSMKDLYFCSEGVVCLFVHDCVFVWSVILFIAWPQEEPQLACAGRRWWGLQLSLLTRRASVYEEKTGGFDVKLREHPVSILSPSLPLALLRLEFISLPPFSSQSGKTSLGNSLDYPIIFLLQHSSGEWQYTTEISSRFFFLFLETQHNGLTVSCSPICRPWTARCTMMVTACHSI